MAHEVAALNLDFYRAAAAVIPVLLLVMAFGEARLKIEMKGPIALTDFWFAGAVILLMVGGELSSLYVLANGKEDPTSRSTTVGAIGAGLAFIFIRFAFYALQQRPGGIDPNDREVRWTAIGVCIFGVAIFVGSLLMFHTSFPA